MAKKMWGGRFKRKLDPSVEKFTESISYDHRLAEYDILGSMCHVEVLKRAKLITSHEASRINSGLKSVLSDVKKGKITLSPEMEDIHNFVQTRLEKKIGALSAKLHTLRSRNEQVVFDTKLYCLENIYKVLRKNSILMISLKNTASRYKDLIVPGYTHLQHAQPVSVVYYLGTYVEMLKRDNRRFSQIADNLELTLGSGALAGTDIQGNLYAIKGMPFGKVITSPLNPVDSVSDRDYIVEVLSASAILGMHLSRLCEDLILWSTHEFGFVELDDSVCTGSSLMPQKKNPDVLELIRGYSGRLYGNMVSLLVTLKGLPLSYNRDMQLDKEPLFDSIDIILGSLEVCSKVVKTMKFNRHKIYGQLEDESLYATDMAAYLVKKGMAFRDAHEVVGNIVKFSIDRKICVKDMNNTQLKRFSDLLDNKTVRAIMNPLNSVRSKKSIKRVRK